MTFEDTLRTEIRRQADAVTLPDRMPERAAGRAHQLRNRRRAGVATVAVAAVLAVTLPPVLGDSPDATEMGPSGLPATGPLDLTWQHVDDGLSNMRTMTQDDDGTVYALSTAPGTDAGGMVPGPYPRGLYRLEDDGSWTPMPLEGDPSNAEDLAVSGGTLYTISTGPAADGGTKATLASSSDEGASWDPQDFDLPAPPSDDVEWVPMSSLTLESTASTTLAIVSTSWFPTRESLFPELAATPNAAVEQTDEGYVLRSIEVDPDLPAGGPTPEDLRAATTTPPTTVPPADPAPTTAPPATAPPTTAGPSATTAPPTTAGPGTTAPPTTAGPSTTAPPTTAGPSTTAPPTTAPPTTTAPAPDTTTPPTTAAAPEATVVRTVTWAEMGIEGPEDLASSNQVLRWDGDAWEALDGAGDAFDGLNGASLDVAGGRFVANAWMVDEGKPVAFTSEDGSAWAQVTPPGGGTVYGMGSALVAVETGPGKVSTDGGATWADFDLTEAGALEPVEGTSIAAGPLGLALVVEHPDGVALAVSSDLRDWSVTPLSDIVGELPGTLNGVTIHVGEDRVVVTANSYVGDDAATDPSATAIGVPTRS